MTPRRALARATAALAAAALAVALMPPAAHAGEEVGAPVALAVTPLDSGRTLITARPLSAPLSGADVIARGALMFYPTASTDGRTLAYVRFTSLAFPERGATTVVVRDGRRILAKKALSIPLVSPDGSTVWFSNRARVLVSLNVTTGERRIVCPECPVPERLLAGSVSPDGRFVARLVGTAQAPQGVVEIRRISDGRRVAAARWLVGPLNAFLPWSPDGRTIAFSTGAGSGGSPTTVVIRTLSVDGEVQDTAFAGSPTSPAGAEFYTSPVWLRDRVWATKVVLTGAQASGRVTAYAVSAADWDSAPVVVGRPLVKSKGGSFIPYPLMSTVTFGLPAKVRGGR